MLTPPVEVAKGKVNARESVKVAKGKANARASGIEALDDQGCYVLFLARFGMYARKSCGFQSRFVFLLAWEEQAHMVLQQGSARVLGWGVCMHPQNWH